jgi:hypothetical protein
MIFGTKKIFTSRHHPFKERPTVARVSGGGWPCKYSGCLFLSSYRTPSNLPIGLALFAQPISELPAHECMQDKFLPVAQLCLHLSHFYIYIYLTVGREGRSEAASAAAGAAGKRSENTLQQ